MFIIFIVVVLSQMGIRDDSRCILSHGSINEFFKLHMSRYKNSELIRIGQEAVVLLSTAPCGETEEN
jgi:hypothetical protein